MKENPWPTNLAFTVIGALLAVITQLLLFPAPAERGVLQPGSNPGSIVQGDLRIAPTPTFGPVPTPVGPSRMHLVGATTRMMSTVSRLETKEYDVEASAKGQRDGIWAGPIQVGGEAIQLHIVGTVIGRTDLSQLTLDSDLKRGDVVISPDGKMISIRLPAPDLVVVVNEEFTQFNDHELGWWATEDYTLWTAVRVAGNSYLMREACERGIRDQTRIETERQMEAMLLLGFETVRVTTKDYTTLCGQ